MTVIREQRQGREIEEKKERLLVFFVPQRKAKAKGERMRGDDDPQVTFDFGSVLQSSVFIIMMYRLISIPISLAVTLSPPDPLTT